MANASHSLDEPLEKALARVAYLESQLEASQNSAKLAHQELQHFVYAASHDLQEPLRAITAYSQLLARMYANDREAGELITFITTGVRRMNDLLQKLLVYSRVNQSPVLSNVRLNAAVQAALFKLDKSISESGAVIRFADLPEFPAHEIQVSQLFEQVITNSILYRGSQKPEIEICAEQGDIEGLPAYIVSVKDNGMGIEEQYLKQVIQPFKRLHGKDYPGNGLGLAICEKIMRAHKGRLWIESDGSSWTCVRAAFPC